jgi:hypothetical protein
MVIVEMGERDVAGKTVLKWLGEGVASTYTVVT